MDSDINYIIQESLKGDKNYQEILLKRLNPLIFKNIYMYYSPSNPITEDLLQEGYIVILESLKEYDEKRNVHFLQYVKVNLYYFYKNYYKKTTNTTNILSIESLNHMGKQLKSTKLNHVDALILKENREYLNKSINDLSEIEQNVLRLFYFNGYSIENISNELDMDKRKVINIKSKILKKLRIMLTKPLFQ